MKLDSDLFCNWRVFANKTLEWYLTDSEEKYKENLIKNYDKLQELNWVNSSFTYEFNSHGFRCKEFTDTDSILFLGCSVTCGIGLPLETIFPEIVSKKINLNCINLGVGGSSADTAFRLAQIYLPKLKPKIVVATLLFPERTELLTGSGVKHFFPMQLKKDWDRKYNIDYYEAWIECYENAFLNITKNVLALHKFCDNLGIKFINTKDLNLNLLYYKQKARDLVHHGVDFHQQLSELILAQL